MKPATKRTWMLALAALLSVVAWHSPVLYPFKILVVFIHEMGHAWGAVLTGGSVVSLVVNPDQSGHAVSRGGWFVIISSAGYVGSALAGAGLLMSSARPRWHRFALFVLAAVMLTSTILWVPLSNPFGLAFGLGGSTLLLLAVIKRLRYLDWLIAVIAAMCCLYAVYDFSDYLLYDAARTDAGILARALGAPILTLPIGVVWSLLSIAILLWSARRSLLR